MSQEIVKEIMKAEARAETIKREAVAQAKQIAYDNQKACSALLVEMKALAHEEKVKALREADDEAQKIGTAQHAQIALQCEAIAVAAASKTQGAVELLVERIVRGG